MALARRGSSTDTSRSSASCRGDAVWYWANAWNTMMVACGDTWVTRAWGRHLEHPLSPGWHRVLEPSDVTSNIPLGGLWGRGAPQGQNVTLLVPWVWRCPQGLDCPPGRGLSGFPKLLRSRGTSYVPQGHATSWESQGHPQDPRGSPMSLGSHDTRGVPRETCHDPGGPKATRRPLLKLSSPIFKPLPPGSGCQESTHGCRGDP